MCHARVAATRMVFFVLIVMGVGLSQSSVRRLTTDGYFKAHLAFSPDGSHLAYSREIGRQFSVCVANADGTGERQLTQNRPDFAPRFHPTWSADGKKIAFISIALSGTDGELDVHVMNADGSEPTPLITGKAFDNHPAFSPDGKRIAFTSTRSGNQEIYVADADGKNVKPLTDHVALDQYPAWSPDSKRIAFSSFRDGNGEIYAMDADGKNVVRLTNHPRLDFYPQWSPDGTRIAFVSNRDGDYEIYVVNVDGAEPKHSTHPNNVTQHPAIDQHPAWTRDGKNIAFVSNRDGRYDVYLTPAPSVSQAVK